MLGSSRAPQMPSSTAATAALAAILVHASRNNSTGQHAGILVAASFAVGVSAQPSCKRGSQDRPGPRRLRAPSSMRHKSWCASDVAGCGHYI